jgi:hypothetical protein
MDRTVVCIIALHFAAFLTLALVLTWLPAYLNQGLGYAPKRAGQLFAAVLIASAPVSIVLSACSQRLMRRGVASRIARGAFVCACLGIGGALLVGASVFDVSSGAKVVLIALAIATTPIIYSLGPAMVAQIAPPSRRGAALAFEYSIAWIADIVAPPGVGWLIRNAHDNIAVGFEQGLLLTGALLIVLAVGGFTVLNPERSIKRLSRRASA